VSGVLICAIALGGFNNPVLAAPQASGNQIIERINALEVKMDQKFDALDQKFDALEVKMDKVDQKFDALEVKMDQKFMALELDLKKRDIKTAQMLYEIRNNQFLSGFVPSVLIFLSPIVMYYLPGIEEEEKNCLSDSKRN
jgi:hypothetical protein